MYMVRNVYTTSKDDNRFSDWTKRLQASDAAACGALFDAAHAELHRYALRLTHDQDAAEDIVQDAFIKLWEIREKLDPERSLHALLYRIVRNLAFNHERYKQREMARRSEVARQTVTEREPIDETIDADALAIRLREWIDELPPRRREAFQLSRFDGLSHEAIAEAMDLTPRTVTNHIMLALQTLRDRLEEYQSSRGPR